MKNLNLARKKFCVRNILSNELVAKDQSFPRLNESRRADFSRGLCGARTVLDLDNYAERKKGGGREREREKRQWQRGSGKWQTDTTITTTHPGISSLRITPRRNTGKEGCYVEIYWNDERGWIRFSLPMKSSRTQSRKETLNDFLISKDGVVNPLPVIIIIVSTRGFIVGLSRRNLEETKMLSFR